MGKPWVSHVSHCGNVPHAQGLLAAWGSRRQQQQLRTPGRKRLRPVWALLCAASGKTPWNLNNMLMCRRRSVQKVHSGCNV